MLAVVALVLLGIIMTVFRPVWRVLRFALKPILWLMSMAWRGMAALFSLGSKDSAGERPNKQERTPHKVADDEAAPAKEGATPGDD